MSGNFRVILDNGGGVTLQLGDYAHHYADGYFAGRDLREWLLSGDRRAHRSTRGWEGAEVEALEVSPTPEEIRNGGYCVIGLGDDDTHETLAREIEATGFGRNAFDLARGLLAAE